MGFFRVINRFPFRPQHRMGAVADLRHVKDAARVARAVMDHSTHSLLVGESGKSLLEVLLELITLPCLYS